MSPRSPLLLFVASLIALQGCAHRGGGMGFPGPLSRMGVEPEQAPTREEEAPTAAAPRRKRSQRVSPPGPREGQTVADAAAAFVGDRKLIVKGESYRYDCSGMIIAAHAAAGMELRGSTKDLYELAEETGTLHHRRKPTVGDVVFFDNTHDRNGNGRRDDDLTHIAIVEDVDEDGTITLVHLGNSGVTRLVMNLKHEDERENSQGEIINSQLRSGRKDGGPTTTAGLYRAFGSLWAIDGQAVSDALPCEVSPIPD
jgi:hypothetical protein